MAAVLLSNGSPVWMPRRGQRLPSPSLGSSQGNLSNAKSVGEGVLEYRIDWGPGYRIYFGRDGNVLVILLTGGTKKRQQRDIETAKALWADCKRRKPRGR